MSETKYGIYDPTLHLWICNKEYEIYVFDTVKLAEAQINMFRYRNMLGHVTPEIINRYIVKPYEEQ